MESFPTQSAASSVPNSQPFRRLKAEALQARRVDATDDLKIYVLDTITSNFLTWYVTLIPSDMSLYYGGKFKIMIVFPEDYPMKPPSIRFLTKIFHPNIEAESGVLHSAALSLEWSPIYTADTIIRTTVADLDSPLLHTWQVKHTNPDGEEELREESYILNPDAATLWMQGDRDLLDGKIAEWLVTYAAGET